jgi:hypothetical protein
MALAILEALFASILLSAAAEETLILFPLAEIPGDSRRLFTNAQFLRTATRLVSDAPVAASGFFKS